MTTAVYILSPNDKIDSFASQAQELEYDARKVLVGPSDGDVRTVVFLDGSPTELKNAIANDKEAKLLLEKLKSRVENMLKVVRVGYEDLNVFVHFRNQGSDELPNFNKKLKTLTADYSFFRCYAISFGNTYPPSLFPNSIFSPPNGDGFVKICNEINNGGLDELEHLRALRLMFPLYNESQNGDFFLDTNIIFYDKRHYQTFNDAITQEEREWIFYTKHLKEFFKMENKDDWVKTPDHLSYKEYEFLMLNLLSKGDKK